MKLFLQIILILLIVLTISICVIKPEMHKSVIVYDSAYKLVEETEETNEKEDIPILESPTKPISVTVKTEKIVEPTAKELKKTDILQKQTSPKTTVQQKQKVEVQTKKPQTVETEKTVTQQKQIKPNATVQKKQAAEIKQTETQKPIQKTETQTKIVEKPKVLTEQEETVAWNIWRSNLTNKIMQDSRLPILPAGVVFRFSFTVDKYGKVSNVQTWSETSTYTPYAVQYIAPVIRSYQGREILNFPEGTQRISTVAKGGWKISTTEKYSTPQDFNDIEKIKTKY